MSVPRSIKHARTSTEGSTSSHSPPPRVKRERSPSPSFAEKKLVTSGTKRFIPIPNDCLPPCTGYKQNRLRWVARCVKELEALDLIPERRLFRDDGLAIDWRSHVPVWSDTLKPGSQELAPSISPAHSTNVKWHHPLPKESPSKSVTTVSTQERPRFSPSIPSDLPDVEPPSMKRFPAPSQPSSRHRNNRSQMISVDSPSSRLGRGSSSCSETLQFSERETHLPSDRTSSLSDPVPIPSRDNPSQYGQIGVPSKLPRGTGHQSTASDTSSAAEDGMTEMTLNYLRRYVQTYESDRASLASAYASHASFAYRFQHMVQNISERSLSVWAATPRCFFSSVKRGRLDIVATLLTLPRLHSNASSPCVAQIEYDIFYLGAELGMFVVCRAVDAAKTVAHNFILRRKEVDVEDAGVDGVWPLTATAHQILVFSSHD